MSLCFWTPPHLPGGQPSQPANFEAGSFSDQEVAYSDSESDGLTSIASSASRAHEKKRSKISTSPLPSPMSDPLDPLDIIDISSNLSGPLAPMVRGGGPPSPLTLPPPATASTSASTKAAWPSQPATALSSTEPLCPLEEKTTFTKETHTPGEPGPLSPRCSSPIGSRANYWRAFSDKLVDLYHRRFEANEETNNPFASSPRYADAAAGSLPPRSSPPLVSHCPAKPSGQATEFVPSSGGFFKWFG